MLIGELAERTGVSRRLLRYYESQGLLRPGRGAGGYRSYTAVDVDTVRRIRTLLAAGLGTATIAEMLPCLLDAGAEVVVGCPDLVDLLVQERSRVQAAMGELAEAGAALDRLIDAGRAAPAGAC